jgi:Leucine-rich repeat (LRR) protein
MNGSAIRLLLGLRKLNMSHNQLEQIPNELSKPPVLEVLNLSHNNLISFPDCGPVPDNFTTHSNAPAAAANRSTPTSPASPTSPSLKRKSSLSSNEKPKADLPWMGLKVLNLSHNELEVMPENVIENATKLVELYLDHNYLEALPPPHCLIRLTQLKRFTAYSNDIPYMPAALLELLPSVKYMNVRIYF